MTEIRRAGAADRDLIAGIWGEAFRDDPMLTWPLYGDAEPEAVRQEFSVLLELYLSLGVVWVADDDGAAAWFPPADADRFAELERPTRDRIRPLTPDAGARYDVFWDWLASHVPDDPCYFLDIVGVRRKAQGRGVGRALVEHGLDRARRDGLPAFLETGNPVNVPIYERLGFRLVEQATAPDAGPTIWFMRAEPPG